MSYSCSQTAADAAGSFSLPVFAASQLPGCGADGGALSARQGEVLLLLAERRSNREIAAALVLSVRTVEHHLARIYAKINARGRADAAAYAVRHGLLPAAESLT